MKASPIKTSFNAGELTPLMAGRVDNAKYASGCSILQNLIPTTQGPIVRRGGTMYANEARTSANRSWLKEFIFNVTQSYVLEFGDQYIRFYTNRGLVLESPTTISAATKANPCSITDTSHGYSTGDQIYIASVGGMTQLNGKMYKIIKIDANTYTLTDIDGNAINSTGYTTYTGGGTASRVYTIATPYAVADLTDSLGNFALKFVQSNNVLYIFNSKYQTQKLSRLGNTNWSVTAVATTNGPFQVTNSILSTTVYASATTGSVSLTASAAIFQSTDVGELFFMQSAALTILPQWSPGITVTTGALYRAGNNTYKAVASGTTGTVTPTQTVGTVADGNPGVSWTYQDSNFGIVQITGVSSSTSASGTVITQLPTFCVGSSNATYLWAHSLFSNTFGWPEVGTFFRDRLTLFKGIQMAASVTSDYENFAPLIGGIQTADCSIVITLPTANPPRWAIDAGNLLVGTAGEEIVVAEISSSSPLAPSNIAARRASKYGSRNVDAQLVGYGILYATRSGQKIRDCKWNWQINSYDSVDVSVMGEHVPKGINGQQGITQICYAQEPYYILWCVTSDGRLAGFTYNREQDVQAWHNHPIGGSNANAPLAAIGITNATVESVVSVPSPDGTRDDVWIQVCRTINGVTRRYIEYVAPEFLDVDANIANAFYVDAGLTYSGPSTSRITGLYHLKGQTVDVLANGGAHPQVVVDQTGAIELQFAVTKAQVGLPCPALVRTMRPEAGSPLGSAQGKIKRITHVILRLLRSLGGWYGPDNDTDNNGDYLHMDQIQYRQADGPMDTPPPTLTGDTGRLQWPGGAGADNTDGYVEVYIDTPTPFTLIALMADLQTNEY